VTGREASPRRDVRCRTWEWLDHEFTPARRRAPALARPVSKGAAPDGVRAELRAVGLTDAEKGGVFEGLATIAGKKLSDVATTSVDPMVWQEPKGPPALVRIAGQ